MEAILNINQMQESLLHAKARIIDLDEAVRRANVKYHDRIAVAYDSDPSTAMIYQDAIQSRIARNVEYLSKLTDAQTFLDVGCGTGNVTKFGRKEFHQALGIDISMGMLRVARAKHRLDVCLADGYRFPLRSASVDAVCCYSVLHHIYCHEPYWREFARVLKSGGYFYSDFDPNALCLLRHRIVRRLIRPLWNVFSKMLQSGTTEQSLLDSRTLALQEMAEYHQNYTDGLVSTVIKNSLLEAGFKTVRIYFHCSTLDLRASGEGSTALSKIGQFVWPFIAVVAVR
jgi:ubiquinone/menaquinone biosynthesis C-methylase UbiE